MCATLCTVPCVTNAQESPAPSPAPSPSPRPLGFPAVSSLSLTFVDQNTDDTEYRPFSAAHPEDVVAYEVPQAVVTFSRHFSPAVTGAVAEPIDFSERLFFAGVQVRQTAKASLLVTFRRTAFSGITTFPASPRPPNFTGSALIVEQRYGF